MSRSGSPHRSPSADADAPSQADVPVQDVEPAQPAQRLTVPPAERKQPSPENEKLCPGCHSGGKRNLVVCIDGTSNQFSTKNTNVVELYSRLIKDERQLTFYNSGIGTYAKPSWRSWSYLKQVIINKLDLAFALRLEKIIMSAYMWLVDNYKPGDRIFLFGFSRGAYQVRALAAMIETVGLLQKGNNDQIAFAYELYAASGDENVDGEAAPERNLFRWLWATVKRVLHGVASAVSRIIPQREMDQSAFPTPRAELLQPAERARGGTVAMQKQFKDTFSRSVHVHFVGAWDTVSSVGLVRDKTLPGTTDGMKSVCFFRHALALHEYRVKFLPEYANGGHGPDPETPRDGFSEPHTKEVWFTGSHSDIGGGSTANTTLDKFGPALRWMSWEATLAGLRLDNNPSEWELIGVSKSMTAIWRMLEFLPIKHLSYKDSGKDRHRISALRGTSGAAQADVPASKKQLVTRRPHFCANRQIKPGQRIHRSVYDECYKFNQPEMVDREPDEYIEVTTILRPKDEVLLRGRVLDEQGTHRLETLLSSLQGRDALGGPNVVQYIYDIARACLQSDGAVQILKDLWLLHAAMVKASFLPRVSEDIDLGHVTDIAKETSKTFPFHMCGHSRPVSSVVFLSNTRVVSGSWDSTVRIWDVSTGEMNLGSPLRGHSDFVRCVAVHAAKGLVASASDDAIIRPWMFDSNGAVHAGKILQDGRTSYVFAVAFSRDGSHLVSGSEDGAIRLWNTATGERVGEPVRGHTSWVLSVAFSSDGTWVVSGSIDRTVRLWEWSAGDATLRPCGEPLYAHTDCVNSVAFSPDTRVIASASDDRTVGLWDVGTRTLISTLEGHTGPVLSVTFAPSSGKHVVSSSVDWTVHIWDAHSGAAVRVLRGHTGPVMSVAFSPGGTRIASGSSDKTVRVWDFLPDPDAPQHNDDVPAAQVAST